jgi:outer membrane protein W
MKKATILLITGLLIFTQSSYAQEAGLFRVGGGLALGTETALDDDGSSKMGVGITITGDYFFTDKIALAPAFTFFFPSKIGDPSTAELSFQGNVLDFDGKYYFLADNVKLYGLFGLSIGFATAKATFDFGTGPQTSSESDSEFGVNIGAGVDYYISETMFLNGQLKYNTPFDQLAINLGVGFNLGQ